MTKKRESAIDKAIRLVTESRDGRWKLLCSEKADWREVPSCKLCKNYSCDFGTTKPQCPLARALGMVCVDERHPFEEWINAPGDFDHPKSVAAAKKVREALNKTLRMLRKEKREKEASSRG